MTKLSQKETTLLLTIKGESPLGYSFIEKNELNISNKLLFLYRNLKGLTEINHDIIRLIQTMGIESNKLSHILLMLNYQASSKHIELDRLLFDMLFDMIRLINIKELYLLDRSGMMDKTPTITEELTELTISEGLEFISLYYYGHDKRNKGNKILFNEYVKTKRDLTYLEMLFIFNNFSYSYSKIDINMIEKTCSADVIELNNSFMDNTFSCFRKPGDCSSWGLPYIEVSYGYDSDLNLRYIEETSGDDYTQGFWKQFSNINDLNTFVIEVITPYLNEAKINGMKDNKDFTKYFLDNGVYEDDLDFN